VTEARGRAAIIVTHNRPQLLAQCIAAIQPQVDEVLVIDNFSNPKATVPAGVTLHYIPDQPPNLARLWNHGLDFWEKLLSDRPHDVAILCDDAIVPTGWFSAVTQAMRETGTTAGSTNPWGTPHEPHVKRLPDRDIGQRMCSWAFVVDNTVGVRADESMHWWWFDTDFDIQCRLNGGTVLVGGWPVPNLEMGHYTATKPELGAQAGRDRQTFAAKYGGTPW
jgi:glycosyltransferase involved in cell wall biosynthesis